MDNISEFLDDDDKCLEGYHCTDEFCRCDHIELYNELCNTFDNSMIDELGQKKLVELHALLGYEKHQLCFPDV